VAVLRERFQMRALTLRKPAPFSRWTLRDNAAQRRLALLWASDVIPT